MQERQEERDVERTAVTEHTPLLASVEQNVATHVQCKPSNDSDVLDEKLVTTWRHESKLLVRSAAPMLVTLLLQNSLTITSIFTVGRIGTEELGAVSLASVTANITGVALYQGLATALDTLCAQAFGSGNKKLVGLQVQRMTWFLWLATVPVGAVWILSERILAKILLDDQREVARLAGLYLKVLLLGTPGFAAFEAGRRYVQAQGLFNVSMYVLLICAPLNALLNWAFVWRVGLGFVGAPLATAMTYNLLPIILFLYVRFVMKDGLACWDGFSWRAFSRWGPMVKLAAPGFLMLEVEFLAFEALTLAASYFGTDALAAQTISSTVAAQVYQIPFSVSIAGGTRLANLIGAGAVDAARTSGRVTYTSAVFAGIFDMCLLIFSRHIVPRLFGSEPDVAKIVAVILPICGGIQFFDALASCGHGILRGLGRQAFGGYLQLFTFYTIALPISFGTAFGLGWELRGLWAGIGIGVVIIVASECAYLYRLDWEKSAVEAKARNENQ